MNWTSDLPNLYFIKKLRHTGKHLSSLTRICFDGLLHVEFLYDWILLFSSSETEYKSSVDWSPTPSEKWGCERNLIFILLSRESGNGVMLRIKNPHSLRSCHFPKFFGWFFDFFPAVNLLHVWNHQAVLFVVKRLIPAMDATMMRV